MPNLFWILFGVLMAVALAALIVGAIALHKASKKSATAASEKADEDIESTTPGPDEGSYLDSIIDLSTFPSPAVVRVEDLGFGWPLTSESQPNLDSEATIDSLVVRAGDLATVGSAVIGAPFGEWTANSLSQPGNSEPILSSRDFAMSLLPVYDFTLDNGLVMRAFLNKSDDPTVGLVEGVVDASSVVTWLRRGDYNDMDGIMSVPYDGALKLLVVNGVSGEGLSAYNATSPHNVFSNGNVLIRRDHDMDVITNSSESVRDLPTGVTALTDLALTSDSGTSAQIVVSSMHGFDEIIAYAVHTGTTVGTLIARSSVTSAGTISLSSGMAVDSVYDIYVSGKLEVSGQPNLDAYSKPIKIAESFTLEDVPVLIR